jgi:hypothetical protein
MRQNIYKWGLIILGSISWSLTMIKSGLFYSSLGNNGSGMGFWGANGHDGIWHIALSESLNGGSFQMPTFAGSNIQNYHIGFDLLLVLLHRVTFISIPNLYFQILPPLFALGTGLLVYWFVWDWQRSKTAAWWATFFTYFGGSFAWLIGKGESTFWSQEAISTLINPPFALSLILILLGLILLVRLSKKSSLMNFIFAVVIFGVLIEIKSYAGIICLGALFVSGVYSYFKDRDLVIIKVFLYSLVVSVILYLPLNINSAGLLVFQPFWFLETLMGAFDRLNWPRFYSAMMSYKSGHNFPKMVLSYGVAFVIFWIGNMGSRIIGKLILWKWLKKYKNLGQIEYFVTSVILAGGLIPILFLQKGTPWNTIQFFYYSLFFSGILAGVAVGHFLENSKLNTSLIYIIEVLIIILTIPTTFITLKDVYIPSRPPAMLANDEISALNFLSKEPKGVVLTRPFSDFDSKAAESNPPRPLYLYISSAYVSAFSKHPVFIEDEINLDITGYNWSARRLEVLSWYEEKDFKIKREFLNKHDIKYIYWIKGNYSPLDLGKLNLKNIFENDSVIIYQVE